MKWFSSLVAMLCIGCFLLAGAGCKKSPPATGFYTPSADSNPPAAESRNTGAKADAPVIPIEPSQNTADTATDTPPEEPEHDTVLGTAPPPGEPLPD